MAEWVGEAEQPITDRGGWWWPTDDLCARPAIVGESIDAIPWVLSYVRGGDIIQAGGNVGVYPVALSPFFETVYTFEPDPLNFTCLQRNIAGRVANVRAVEAGLGEEEGVCEAVAVEPNNCGAHRLIIPDVDDPEERAAYTPLMTIDSLQLRPSCIWLDVEGFELPAIRGARETIRACSPVIVVEQKGLGLKYGHSDDHLTDLLAGLGYVHRSSQGNDHLYTRE